MTNSLTTVSFIIHTIALIYIRLDFNRGDDIRQKGYSNNDKKYINEIVEGVKH